MTPVDYTRCHAILKHTDTVWRRCPKADKCLRHRDHQDDQFYVVNRLCNTVEFEHFMEIPDET